jgi:hypothetical protein
MLQVKTIGETGGKNSFELEQSEWKPVFSGLNNLRHTKFR